MHTLLTGVSPTQRNGGQHAMALMPHLVSLDRQLRCCGGCAATPLLSARSNAHAHTTASAARRNGMVG
jgi:hypothetical protein